jgi:hypothetical protein
MDQLHEISTQDSARRALSYDAGHDDVRCWRGPSQIFETLKLAPVNRMCFIPTGVENAILKNALFLHFLTPLHSSGNAEFFAEEIRAPAISGTELQPLEIH